MDTSLAHREKPLRSRTKEREVTGRPGHATHRAGALTEVQSGLCDEMGIDGRRLENQSQTVLRCNPASVTTLGGVWIHAYTADRPPLRPTPPPRQHRIHTGWRATHAMGMMMGQPSKLAWLAWNRRTSCVMPSCQNQNQHARYGSPTLAHREKPLRSRTKEREVTGRPGHATHRAGALTEVQSGLCDEMGIDGRECFWLVTKKAEKKKSGLRCKWSGRQWNWTCL